tara:strand:+ start:14 stop:547 length:534 start_codon:yes stop_codon:yes gene_type:complete
MSRVIKNNDGVAIVEGTPASSLVKDINKFFAAKPPERMAGESVSRPRKLDPRTINTRRPTPKDLEQMNNLPVEKPAIRSGRRPSFENLSTQEQAEVTARREQMMEDRKARAPLPRRDPRDTMSREGERPLPRRNEAKDRAESRRKRFFERRRSKKEAKRSQREQEATQGKFITTLER